MEVTGMKMKVTSNPMKGPQGVLEIIVPLSSLRIGPSKNFYHDK